ncbi:MAG: dienelactone hydrolase family protein [Kiloniellaceae bacterium]|nr:dienelactone hydrolase family protein [Kiloniellaceae bacterium]
MTASRQGKITGGKDQAAPTITQEIIDLYDEYTHLTLDRRRFFDHLSRVAGGTAAAYALLPVLENNYAEAAMMAPDDSRLKTEKISFPGASGEMMGYLARPAEPAGRLPAVLVIHENRGLNPHIEDVTRRMALEGFVALGVDFLSPAGGTPADEDQAREMIGALDTGQTIQDAVAAVDFLANHPDSNGKVGSVGFCWGGAMSNQVAVNSPAISATVAYYGRQPAADQVANIKAPMLLHYAGLDERINAGIPGFEAALKSNGVNYDLFVYDDANHAFNNDTNAARYDAKAADVAWSRTVNFFKENLQ